MEWPNMKSEFDICIIGAGMAGATIAAHLAGNCQNNCRLNS